MLAKRTACIIFQVRLRSRMPACVWVVMVIHYHTLHGDGGPMIIFEWLISGSTNLLATRREVPDGTNPKTTIQEVTRRPPPASVICLSKKYITNGGVMAASGWLSTHSWLADRKRLQRGYLLRISPSKCTFHGSRQTFPKTSICPFSIRLSFEKTFDILLSKHTKD